MPRIVGQMMGLLQEVLEKLAALELMLTQKPIISGRYSGIQYLRRTCYPQNMAAEGGILALPRLHMMHKSLASHLARLLSLRG